MNRHRQKKLILGPGFQVSVSLYLYFFFFFFTSSSGNVEICLARVLEGNGKAGGAFGFGIMWKMGRCDSGRACVLLHARASFTVAAEDVVRFVWGSVQERVRFLGG